MIYQSIWVIYWISDSCPNFSWKVKILQIDHCYLYFRCFFASTCLSTTCVANKRKIFCFEWSIVRTTKVHQHQDSFAVKLIWENKEIWERKIISCKRPCRCFPARMIKTRPMIVVTYHVKHEWIDAIIWLIS